MSQRGIQVRRGNRGLFHEPAAADFELGPAESALSY